VSPLPPKNGLLLAINKKAQHAGDFEERWIAEGTFFAANGKRGACTWEKI